MVDLNGWLVKAFGEIRAKWIKSVIGGALILIIGYWTAPITTLINSLGWTEVFKVATIQTLNISLVVIIAFIILFFGKPFYISPGGPIEPPEEEVEGYTKVEPEPDKPVVQVDL